MKRKILRRLAVGVGIVLVFLVAFVAINLSDAPRPDRVFTPADLAPASLDKENRYFRMMAFSYPGDVDIKAPEVMERIRRFSEPGVLMRDPAVFDSLIRAHRGATGSLSVQGDSRFLKDVIDHPEWISAHKEQAAVLIKQNPVLVERFKGLLDASRIEDFSLPAYSYPVADAVLVSVMARLFLVKNVLDVQAGDWDKGIKGILEQIALFRKLGAGSRQVVNRILSYNQLRQSLRMLARLINQEGCPEDILHLTLNQLEALDEPSLGIRNLLIFDFLSALRGLDDIDHAKGDAFESVGVLSAGLWPDPSDWLNFLSRFGIFLHRNRTMQYYLDEIAAVLSMERRAPYLWRTGDGERPAVYPCKGWFWWFRNPVGKAYMSIGFANHRPLILQKFQIMALVDLVRIAARCRLRCREEALSDIQAELARYAEIDPFSGKAYRYRNDKQVVYSLGVNGVDDGGDGGLNESRTPLDLVIRLSLQGK